MLKISLLAGATVLLLAIPAAAADLKGEIVNAHEHADYAAESQDLATTHMHLQHALNCLVGPDGNGFDAKQMNPCAHSGNGIIPDTTDARKKKMFKVAAQKAIAGMAETDLVKSHKIAADVAAMLQ